MHANESVSGFSVKHNVRVGTHVGLFFISINFTFVDFVNWVYVLLYG